MHGNKKLCRIFLGKCTGAPCQNLTTKKPPNLVMRGLFFCLFIGWFLVFLFQTTARELVVEFLQSAD
jgi:hypothetical protein